MKRKNFGPMLIGVALLCSGCASWPLTDAVRESLPPFPYEYRALTLGYVETSFRDPESARIAHLDAPEPAYRAGTNGWVWRTEINARNAFGGYSGWIRFDFYLDDLRRLWCFRWSPFFKHYGRYTYDPNELWATEEELRKAMQ